MPRHFRSSWLFVIVTDGDPLDLRTHVKNLLSQENLWTGRANIRTSTRSFRGDRSRG